MEVVTGTLPRLLSKLSDLLISGYKLQNRVNVGIKFLQIELKTMQSALEKISEMPPGQLDKQDKIWARDVRELSYDIEDCIDVLMVRSKDSEPVGAHGFRIFLHKCCDILAQVKIRCTIATEISSIERSIIEVCQRRHRYRIENVVAKPIAVSVDPRLLAQYKQETELVGIEAARDDIIKILVEGDDDIFMLCAKTVSIVGFGGLGKTTLAKAVYEKIGAQFDCQAFVSVSQTPDMMKLFKSMLYGLSIGINDEKMDEQWLINKLREFLQEKRYLIVFDDIWDISVWKVIKCALPDSYGHKIIITTRIFDIAKQIGGSYKMKPLSVDDSKELLYNTIFGSEEKHRLPEELTEVSHTMLKKCAGVPLAIITIASLLRNKGRSKTEWCNVCKSIGTGLENSLDVENMRKILSFSYYDLPYHLRTCLLYLSVFPEDYKISKDRLIKMWIAEGFILCDEQKKQSLFELGESYFHELINRSMIQPVYTKYSTVIEQCCLHDMVLDLIRSLSSEENFIDILNDVDLKSPSHKVRRLCAQYDKVDLATTEATRSLHQVRSLVFVHSTLGQMPSLGKFRVLRVLDLPGCDLSQECSLKFLGKFRHLRYLGLRCTRIAELPKAIKNLVFLQTLDVTANHNLRRLPTEVVKLRNLTSLHIDKWIQVPERIGKLTSLEQLSRFGIGINDSRNNIKELGHLTGLRELCIVCHTQWNDCLEKSLVECLSKLQKIQTLSFQISESGSNCLAKDPDSVLSNIRKCNLNAWVVPQHLRKLDLTGCWFCKLPVWMNHNFLLDLSFLCISVRELQQEDLQILGKLPALHHLNLKVDRGNVIIHRGFFIGAYSFPCLVQCLLREFGGPVVFKQGAMPRLTSLELTFPMCTSREITDMCLGNLSKLQNIAVCFNNVHTSKILAEDALRHATEIHPNRPTIDINYQRQCRLKID